MDQILSKLNNEISEELEIPKDMIQYVINYVINDIRTHIKTGTPQPVLIHNFGTFYLSRNSIPKFKEKLIASYEKGNIKKHKYRKTLKNLEMIEKQYANSNE